MCFLAAHVNPPIPVHFFAAGGLSMIKAGYVCANRIPRRGPQMVSFEALEAQLVEAAAASDWRTERRLAGLRACGACQPARLRRAPWFLKFSRKLLGRIS